LEPRVGENAFRAAEVLSLAAEGMKPASGRAGLSTEEKELGERYAARAVELIKQAQAWV
jgi:hypothetical protein